MESRHFHPAQRSSPPCSATTQSRTSCRPRRSQVSLQRSLPESAIPTFLPASWLNRLWMGSELRCWFVLQCASSPGWLPHLGAPIAGSDQLLRRCIALFPRWQSPQRKQRDGRQVFHAPDQQVSAATYLRHPSPPPRLPSEVDIEQMLR